MHIPSFFGKQIEILLSGQSIHHHWQNKMSMGF